VKERATQLGTDEGKKTEEKTYELSIGPRSILTSHLRKTSEGVSKAWKRHESEYSQLGSKLLLSRPLEVVGLLLLQEGTKISGTRRKATKELRRKRGRT
jgi:hypothetical protein